ncbi:hypothetical protein LY01_01321 [Nonlabens xylanidelens]|uniref:Uncharacterized protein n=1 Tax=Nonlabens xylanidelens TaxID=191564 RepID=A0A2S6ING2_9FLAO|nr:hypothetical protein [Nonlabens xylanidelens]PPK95728.1 hypothetical protein LY01_01321 [Nonlabens xylanidelens]PQJ22521.1 hypothetical protein BST94_02825 [Nonlabens xylanidelens]
MNKKLLLILLIIFFQYSFASEDPILVTESTISLNFDETEELFFSFAEGDIIEFDFEMVKGKHLKEIEIFELPNNKIFSDFKVKDIVKKQIQIRNNGLYKFRFYSSSLTKRVGKIKIYRIPANETTKDFNTNWRWKTLRDTIYTPYTIDSITGYKTIKFKERIKELVSTENVEDLLLNKSQRVHSYYNDNRSSSYLRVDLPNPIVSDLKEERIIAWAYWIGVGQEAQDAYKENARSVGELANGITSMYGTPLAGLAVGTITDLLIPKIGEDVYYSFIPDHENAEKFINGQTYLQFDTGKGIAAYGKNSNLTQGVFYIGLHNDNQVQGIDVDVKVVLVKEVKTYEMVEYDRQKEEPITVTLNKSRMSIKETKIRVPAE